MFLIWNRPPSDPVEFFIDSAFQVTGVGTVVAGTVKSGTVHNNQQVVLYTEYPIRHIDSTYTAWEVCVQYNMLLSLYMLVTWYLCMHNI